MGHYRVTLVAVGGHGCQREKGSGDAVVGCERPNCPDCITREYVRRLKRAGSEQVQVAQIEHWPADLGYPESSLVVDDLLSGIRRGKFPEYEREQKAMSVPVRVILVDTDGTSKVVPITVNGGTSVETIINMALSGKYGKSGSRVRAYTDPEGKRHLFGLPGAEQSSDYDLTFGDGIAWRLGRPSCFGLIMEARHLPKNEPDRVAVYPYDYFRDVEAAPDAK